MNFWGYGGDAHIPPYIFCLLLKKNEKSTRAWPILKWNSTTFDLKSFFLGWIIKILEKDEVVYYYTPTSLWSKYSSSN